MKTQFWNEKQIRKSILKLLKPAIKWAGHLKYEPKNRLVTADDYDSFVSLAQPGDAVVSRSRFQFSNWMIPGDFFTHVAGVASDKNFLIECVDPTCRKVSWAQFLKNKDYVALLRPNLVTQEERKKASFVFEKAVGVPYDYYFEPNVDAMYCAEGFVQAYRVVIGEDIVSPQTLLGVETFLPSAFYHDDSFSLIYQSEKTPEQF